MNGYWQYELVILPQYSQDSPTVNPPLMVLLCHSYHDIGEHELFATNRLHLLVDTFEATIDETKVLPNSPDSNFRRNPLSKVALADQGPWHNTYK